MKWNQVKIWIKNKYILALLFFGIWMIFVDNYDVFTIRKYREKLNKVEQEQVFYEEKIKEAQKAFEELTSNEREMERFARETYFMKRPNEDIFIIVDSNLSK